MQRVILPILSIALLAGCGSAPDVRGVDRDETILTISATGEGQAKPDTATFTAGVSSYGATAQSAIEANSAAMIRILAAVENRGVAKDEVRTETVSIDRSYSGKGATRYRADNRVTIKVRKIETIENVIEVAYKAGANTVDGPHLTISDPDAINRAAIASAYKTARARADAYASAMGLKVDRVLKVQDASGQVGVPVFANEAVTDAAAQAVAPPVRTGMNSMAAQVTIEFVLTK